jgi:hypothetical protein
MRILLLPFAALALIAVAPAKSLAADESVTISKSRLEELERKAAELERLKGSNAPAVKAPEAKVLPVAAPSQGVSAPPAVAAVARPAVQVPTVPLAPGEVISCEELAGHYLSNPSAADARYRGKKITVRGRIVAFDKPLFIRNYKILLQTSESAVRVICDIYPPTEYKAVYTTKEGTELVAVISERERVHLSRLGDYVTIRGQCTGFKGSAIRLTNCSLQGP